MNHKLKLHVMVFSRHRCGARPLRERRDVSDVTGRNPHLSSEEVLSVRIVVQLRGYMTQVRKGRNYDGL